MSISLLKGDKLSLIKAYPDLKQVMIGLGWDPRSTDGDDFDLDASAFMLNSDNKVRSDNDVIFYNHLKSRCGSIIHTGDNRTGSGRGDDESLLVDLSKVPNDIHKIVFTVTIYDSTSRNQNFGQVQNSYIRLINKETSVELTRFDLENTSSEDTSMIFGEIHRKGDDWEFLASGEGYEGGLETFCGMFGVEVK